MSVLKFFTALVAILLLAAIFAGVDAWKTYAQGPNGNDDWPCGQGNSGMMMRGQGMMRGQSMDKIQVEISALSVPAPVAGPTDIVVGKHGIILTQGTFSATFLPHVATEQGWDRDTALTHLSRKAGLDPAGWKDPQTRFEVYTAEVWHE